MTRFSVTLPVFFFFSFPAPVLFHPENFSLAYNLLAAKVPHSPLRAHLYCLPLLSEFAVYHNTAIKTNGDSFFSISYAKLLGRSRVSSPSSEKDRRCSGRSGAVREHNVRAHKNNKCTHTAPIESGKEV